MLHVAAGEKMKMIDLGKQHLIDCSTLTPTALRKRYPAEANSHRNMKQRAKSRGNIIHPEFLEFRDFLTHVGPQPRQRDTLDRIDNTDPEYAPGKVRWADKPTQNSNKGDSLLFHYSRTGDTYTVSRLAKLRNVSPGAIRKCKERRWTDDEIIEGKRHGATVNNEHSPPVPIQRRNRDQYLRPESPRTALEIRWQEDASYAAWYRANEGEEYCLADFELIRDTAAECKPKIIVTREGYEWKFAKWWPRWKPHLKRERLPEWAQELVAKIEGTTLADIRRHQDEMRDRI
jgi:hypothetical protein